MSDLLSGRYELGKILGSGGYGSVYEALDHLLYRRVAVKMLHSVQFSGSVKERFLEEARISSQLAHPSALTVYDFGMSGRGEPFLVTELLEGLSLKDYIDHKACTPAETLVIMSEVAGALNEAHELGIIHRDLKSANIYLHLPAKQKAERGAIAKLLDFGIAKVLQQEGKGVTRSGAIIGTPAFMAPEQIRDSSKVDARCDQYSLGLVGWHAMHGVLPFKGENEFEMMQSQMTAPLPPLACQEEGAEELYELIVQMTHKDPEDRLPDLSTVIDRLQKIRDQIPTPEVGWIGPNLDGMVSIERDKERVYTASLKSGSKSQTQKQNAPPTAQRAGFASLHETLDAVRTNPAVREISVDVDQVDYFTETLVPREDRGGETRPGDPGLREGLAKAHQSEVEEQTALESTNQKQSVGLNSLFPPTESLIEDEQGREERAQETTGEPLAEKKSWLGLHQVSLGLTGLFTLIWLAATLIDDSSSDVQSTLSAEGVEKPARPQLGPRRRFSFKLSTRPSQPPMGFSVGDQFELLVEDRLGRDVSDFKVRDIPPCLKQVPDPMYALYRVHNEKCGMIVVKVGRELVSMSIQAQSWATELLDGLDHEEKDKATEVKP